MRLDAPIIAELARGAGFVDREVHTAVAVALCASGGNTHYHRTAGLAGTGDWQGLWAVDRDRAAVGAGVDLYDPHTAARVVYELVGAHDGWGWSDQVRAGTHVPHLAMAATEATRYGYRQPAAVEMTVGARLRQAAHLTGESVRLRTMLARAPRPGG